MKKKHVAGKPAKNNNFNQTLQAYEALRDVKNG